ncbi:sensor histidine kinase KdpD [Anoxybacterium hadale]|uniref:Sensor histidine kinase KdpD n=1 Tax=Anoxybacterium hadale TaxID=3408580 RepID=A0ACD1AAB7_9FIRM|nr:sensor histidine kinase KdpD [Clostridiales bacterium]
MFDQDGHRPNPDTILEKIRFRENKKKGRLKIFLGYAAGVGKTYSMLDDAHEKMNSGIDVLVGYIEPHTRPETMQMMDGLSTLPPMEIKYKNLLLKEFDLDAALKRKPDLILVDELAHTNAPGTRNKKRYQDIEELLNAGIDVYTTVNIQHIESLNDVVQKITKVAVRETIPDYIFDEADTVEIIDFSPDELIKRFEDGKIYRATRAETALRVFFSKENLRLLREIAMRKVADRISEDNRNEKKIQEKIISTKLLVCINASVASDRSIRWTARTAEAFHAPWVAVYVDSKAKSDEKEIQVNLDLAKRLGAETVRLNGHDVADTIAEYAKISGITNLVIGKVRKKKTIKTLFEIDLEDKLLSLLPDIEVHIIPDIPQKMYHQKNRIKITGNLYFSWSDLIKTTGILIMATLLSMGLQAADIGDQNIIMVYILSVLIIARITIGHIFGITASILSVLLFNFFFTVPYYTFNAIQPGYPITFLIMFLAAFITSTLTVRIKSQMRLSVEREHRTKILYEINKKFLVTRGLENIVALTNEYITNIYDRAVVFYTQDPVQESEGFFMGSATDLDIDLLKNDDERAVAHWVFQNKKRAGSGTDTLIGAAGHYIPIISQAKVLGVIGVSCTKGKLDQNNRLFLRMLGSQVAMALERQYLSDDQREILIETEKEKSRSNLLRAISHDLRTPLTGILGASSTILESGENLDKQTHDHLILNIKEDSQWLIRMVENLLSVTRINEGTMTVTKTSEVAEEVVADTISQIRKRFPERKISVKIPNELLIVPMDGTLIEQVLLNLIENAFKHSSADSSVEVSVRKENHYAAFEVIDEGEGINEEDFPYLFESYIPNGDRSSDSSRGMGIGLSICMSIIKAHKGKLGAANRKEGGAIFWFKLPLKG